MVSLKHRIPVFFLSFVTACAAAEGDPPPRAAAIESVTQAAAGPSSVRVINSTAEPVPTVAQGSTKVHGTVEATQSGPWSVSLAGNPEVSLLAGTSVGIDPASNAVTVANEVAVNGTVGISGTPSVTLSGTPSVNIGNSPTVSLAAGSSVAVSGAVSASQAGAWTVDVNSSEAQPIWVRERHTTEPFQQLSGLDLNPGQTFNFSTLVVNPAGSGRRLVIDHVTGRASLPAGQKALIQVFVQNFDEHGQPIAEPVMEDYLVATPHGNMPGTGGDIFTANHHVRTYVEPGQLFGFLAARDSSASQGGLFFAASGYYQPL